MADVFISFSSKNLDKAHDLLDTLEEDGINCWFAPRDILGGSYYAKEIPKAILDSPIFLLVLSKDAQKSDYVLRELDYAASLNKIILPYSIDGVSLTPEFDFLLRTKQCFLETEDDLVIFSLLGTIHGILKRSPKLLPQADTVKTLSQPIDPKDIHCPLCGSTLLLQKKEWMNYILEDMSFDETVKPFTMKVSIPFITLSTIIYGFEKKGIHILTSVWQIQPDLLWLILLMMNIYVGIPSLAWIILATATEWRRRQRIRNHIKVTRYKCEECAHIFKSVTKEITIDHNK